MGFRFQKRISILPGVRINLSKSGASASIGPKGADVNIGPHGVSTNAGIPGTGLSYRPKLGTHGSWFGVALLVGALAFWAGRHIDQWTGDVPAPAAVTAPATARTAPSEHHRTSLQERIAALQPGTVYVRRGGSVVREAAKSSADVLKHEAKGAAVTLLEKTDDGWAKVKDGDITGWMRASVLGNEAPEP
jgi:hypothetical protein